MKELFLYANVTDLTGIVPLQDVFLETTEDGNGVLIGWSVSDDDLYDNYTVFYCVGKQHVRHRCNVCCSLLNILYTVWADLHSKCSFYHV